MRKKIIKVKTSSALAPSAPPAGSGALGRAAEVREELESLRERGETPALAPLYFRAPDPQRKAEAGRLQRTTAGLQAVTQASGCGNPLLGERFFGEAYRAVRAPRQGDSINERVQAMEEAAAFLASMGPAVDAADGALAAQMWALHRTALNSMAEAAIANDGVLKDVHLNRAMKLLRSFAASLEARDKHRNQGRPQFMRVEHVHVNAGGQAIVGAVEVKGRRGEGS
jgi:hypothetical protein